MQTLVEVAWESFLILDAKLRVISANPIFYESFKVKPVETEGTFIHELGNGQWNIPELRNLLEKVLPEKKVVRNFEVTHTFETIGQKTILLNASQIDAVQLIIIAMEDISDRILLEKKLETNITELGVKVAKRTAELTDRIKELEALNKSMVNRELKMIDLKKENSALKELLENKS